VTEQALTHFKPREIGTSVERLRELGYKKDVEGKELESPDQLLELLPLDVILPSCQESANEKADEVFINLANFMDTLLIRFYGLKAFYNVRTKEDLIGHLIVGLAPHTSAGIVGRIIGFSRTQGCIANPLWHAAQRRDCLGYGSYVPIKKNGNWQIVKIGEFIDELNLVDKADNFGTLKKNISNFCIYGNPGEEKIMEVTKHKPRRMFKIYLEDGRNIELTDNHKVFLKGKKEKRVRDIKPGDKLSVSYKKNIKERDVREFFLPGIFQGREDIMIRNIKGYLSKFENLSKHKNFYHRDSFPIKLVEEILSKHNKTLQDLPLNAKIAAKRDKLYIPVRVPLDEKLLEVIGLYIAEGFSRKKETGKGYYQVSIAGTEEIRNLVK
jgi:DNA polymerase II large subunit